MNNFMAFALRLWLAFSSFFLKTEDNISFEKQKNKIPKVNIRAKGQNLEKSLPPAGLLLAGSSNLSFGTIISSRTPFCPG